MLLALLPQSGEHLRGEVVEHLLDDATSRSALDVVRSLAQVRRLREIPEQSVVRRGVGEATQRAGQACRQGADIAPECRE